MSRPGRGWRLLRPLVGAVVLAGLVWRLGPGPFVDAVRALDAWSLLLATGLGFVSTACCAWRWTLVARGLGVYLTPRTALVAYYRSLLLNATLPGGVVGDVQRVLRHGREVGSLGGAARAVLWERTAGQVTLVGAVLLTWTLLPSPAGSLPPGVLLLPTVAVVVAVVLAVVGVLRVRVPRARPRRTKRWRRAFRSASSDLRAGLLRRGAWPGILATSTVAATAHTATFVVAARATGSAAPLLALWPVALLVLVVAGVPGNLAGWGPREGAAAWAFGVAGLGAAQGVSASVAYGVLVLVSVLPGLPLLLVGWPGPRQGRSCDG